MSLMKSNAIMVGLLVGVFCTLVCRRATADQLVVDSDFEGGSARVIEIDQERGSIQIMPAGDPMRGWPAWWSCRVSGLTEGQTLKLGVVSSTRIIPAGHPGAGKPLSASWALPQRAAWSADGLQWLQTSPGKRDGASMVYELTAVGSELWVAWGPPATPNMMNRWLDSTAAAHPFAETFELAETREGRTVRGIRIASGEKPLEGRPVVWLHARQHAWESGSSWVARGVGEWLVEDSAESVWLRENTQVFLVPIMDIDRVATGDGGKESTPHDHNRDWSDHPHYPEVAAVQKRIRNWTSEDRMVVFVDLHNPGPNDQRAYFYVAPDEAMDPIRKRQRTRFLDTIQSAYDGPIPLDRKTRSTGPSYHPLWQQISSTWVTQHGGDDTVAVCLETPWNTPNSTAAGYVGVGAGLMKGVTRFLLLDRDR
jgi:hypothetical protein